MSFDRIVSDFEKLSSLLKKLTTQIEEFPEEIIKNQKLMEQMSQYPSLKEKAEQYNQIAQNKKKITEEIKKLEDFYTQFHSYFLNLKKQYDQSNEQQFQHPSGMSFEEVEGRLKQSIEVFNTIKSYIPGFSNVEEEFIVDFLDFKTIYEALQGVFKFKFQGIDKKLFLPLVQKQYQQIISALSLKQMRVEAFHFYYFYNTLSTYLRKRAINPKIKLILSQRFEELYPYYRLEIEKTKYSQDNICKLQFETKDEFSMGYFNEIFPKTLIIFVNSYLEQSQRIPSLFVDKKQKKKLENSQISSSQKEELSSQEQKVEEKQESQLKEEYLTLLKPILNPLLEKKSLDEISKAYLNLLTVLKKDIEVKGTSQDWNVFLTQAITFFSNLTQEEISSQMYSSYKSTLINYSRTI